MQEVFVFFGRNLHRVGNEDGGLLLGDGDHVLPLYNHFVLPSEDITVEATRVGCDIHPALVENVFMIGTTVVNHKSGVGPNHGKQTPELLPPGLVAGVHACVVPRLGPLLALQIRQMCT